MKLDERAFDKATAALARAVREIPPLKCYNPRTGQNDTIISSEHARACVEAYLLALQGSPAGKEDEVATISPPRHVDG